MALISAITNIQYDTVYNILLEYTVQSNSEKFNSKEPQLKTINSIHDLSSKYSISKKIIARILFAYKYEMITRDEIEEEALENAEPDVDPGERPDY